MTKQFFWGAIVLGVLLTACKGNENQSQSQAPMELTTLVVSTQEADLQDKYPATVKGSIDTEIRPKVSGFIEKLMVDEGSKVRKGQTLFTIDKVAYQEAVTSAKASVQVAEANLNNAKMVLDNKTRLATKNIIGDSELQAAQYSHQAQKGLLEQAKAQLVKAQNDLSFTAVQSPYDGVVGNIYFREGSLVSNANTVATVSDAKEIFAYFSMNEKQILQLSKELGANGANDLVKHFPEVELQLADGSLYPGKGKIETVSGMVNTSTGTVTLRAKFDNPNGVIRSGSSAVVRIPKVLKDAIYVPQNAVFQTQDKYFVYVLGTDSTVKGTNIQILPINDGKNYIINSGLKSGDQIVIEGINRLKDGMTVTSKQASK